MRLLIEHIRTKCCYQKPYSHEPFSIDVDPSFTMAQIKDVIAQQINLPSNCQSLSFEGHTLENSHRLDSYNGIQDGSTLWLVVSTGISDTKHRLFISIARIKETREIVNLDFFYHNTVAEVKQAIYERTGIDPKAQRLIFAGKQIEDNRVISDYSIMQESTVHLMIRQGV